MSTAGPKGGAKGDRASRLSSALRDNLRRRKAASRPADEADGDRPKDTQADKTAEGGRQG